MINPNYHAHNAFDKDSPQNDKVIYLNRDLDYERLKYQIYNMDIPQHEKDLMLRRLIDELQI